MERLQSWLTYLRQYWVRFTVIAVVSLLVFLAGQNVICNWMNNRVTELGRDSNTPEVNLRSDNSWLDCVYNCGLQVNPKPAGKCVQTCDSKYRRVQQ